MNDAVVLMNGYVVYLNTITNHNEYNPETTPVIFDTLTGRVRQFTKDNTTYMAVDDIKTEKFKYYVNANTFWNNANPKLNTFVSESFSMYNSDVYKLSSIPFAMGIAEQYGNGVKEGRGVAEGTKVILVRESINKDGPNTSIKIEKRSFNFKKDKTCTFEGQNTTGNLCLNETFDNIQHLTGYTVYPPTIIDIQKDELKSYYNNVKNKEFRQENTLDEFYFNEDSSKPIIGNIIYLLHKILENQSFVDYLHTNNLYTFFEKHFQAINEYDMSSGKHKNAQKFYHDAYTERYFNLFYTRLIEFYFWSKGVKTNSLNVTEVIVRLISLFTSYELSALSYSFKIKLLEDLLKNNFWISGKWNAFYSGTKLSEEEVIVKLIRAFYREVNGIPVYSEVDSFLDYLISFPKYEVNTSNLLYQILYQRINDDILFGDTGDGAKGQYVKAIYELWFVSKYNPSPDNTHPQSQNALNHFTYTPYRAPARPVDQPKAAPALLNYESVKASIWYLDNYDFLFEGNLIKATERNPGVVSGSVVGYYHIYQPITIMQTDSDDTIIRMPKTNNDINNGIPVFYLMYADQAGDYSDAKSTIGFAADVILTFTGIGEIKSIKYLTEVSAFRQYIKGTLSSAEKAVFLSRLSAALSGANGFLGVASLVLSYSSSNCSIFYNNQDNPPNPNDPNYIQYKFCQSLDLFLFTLEMVTLSGDLLSKRALKRATKKLRENIPPGSEYNSLRNALNDIDNIVQDLVEFLNTIQSTHPKVYQKVVNFVNEEDKYAFMFNFKGFNTTLTHLEENIHLVDRWMQVKYRGRLLRHSISYLESFDFIKDNAKLRQHVHLGDGILTQGAPGANTTCHVTGLHNLNEVIVPPPYIHGKWNFKNPSAVLTNERGYSVGKVERNMGDKIDPATGEAWETAYETGDRKHMKTKKDASVFWPKYSNDPIVNSDMIDEEMAFAFSIKQSVESKQVGYVKFESMASDTQKIIIYKDPHGEWSIFPDKSHGIWK